MFGRSTAVVKRKSLSTSKKSKKKTRNRIEAAKINSPTAISGMDSLRVGKSVMKSIPGNDSSVNRPENVGVKQLCLMASTKRSRLLGLAGTVAENANRLNM